MSNYTTIQIDFDVYKKIETERLSFAENPNTVLRRLLGIKNLANEAANVPTAQNAGKPWISDSVELPHGTEIRFTQNGEMYSGYIVDGKINIEGGLYKSLSGAAIALLRTKNNKPTNLNGWKLAEAKRPSDTRWYSLEYLRNLEE